MKQNKYSNLKIVGHSDKLQSFREDRITAPLYVRIKPINKCNHGCRFCTYSDGNKRPKDRPSLHLQTDMHKDMNEGDFMSYEKGMELLNSIAKIGVKAITFSGGGEPLMHPRIVDFMKEALALGLDLSIITNGQLLAGARAKVLSKAKWVRVSIDYTDSKTMSESRNVPEMSFDFLMENLANFAAIKENCDLGINYIVTRYNSHGLVPFAAKLKSLGVENIRFSPVYVEGFRAYHLPIKAEVEAQLKELQGICDDRFSINSTYDIDSPSKSPSRPFTRCLYAQTVPVVGADLGVYCCHNVAYSKHGKIGSIADKTFEELWFSPEAQKFLREFNPSCVCHHECAAHEKILIFEQLANSHFDNFV